MDTKKLRQKILDLAIRGKLVPQDPNDEPASVLLERIRAEKEQLIKEGKIKRSKKSAATDKSHYENVPFEIPKNWVWCKLDDLAFYKKGPFGSSLTKSMFIPDNGNAYKVYEQKNAIQKDSNLGHYFISIEKFQELKGFEVLPNDIIVSCAGTIGETYIMPSDIRSGIINQALMIIRLHNIDITPFYLLYFDFILKNEAGKDGKGTAIKNIPPFDILKNYWIPLPPLAEQDRIIKEVALWQCLIDSIDGNIEDIFKLSKKTKSKILDLAISGKLVPQDPDDEPAIELLKWINPGFEPCDNSHYGNLPQGWAVCHIDDILDYEQPQAYIVNNTDYSDEYETPVLTAGKSFIIGYTNENNGICDRLPVIIFDDFTTDSKLVDFPFKVKSSAMKILRTKGEINIDYIAYYMSITRLIGDTHKRYWISEYSKLLIPIPPYQEQLRIVETVETIFNEILKITAELS